MVKNLMEYRVDLEDINSNAMVTYVLNEGIEREVQFTDFQRFRVPEDLINTYRLFLGEVKIGNSYLATDEEIACLEYGSNYVGLGKYGSFESPDCPRDKK